MRNELIKARESLNVKYVKSQISIEKYKAQVDSINNQINELALTWKRNVHPNVVFGYFTNLINEGKLEFLKQRLRKEKIKFTLNEFGEVIELGNNQIS